MLDQKPETRNQEPGPWALWFGVTAGTLAWTAHLLLSYALLPIACAGGTGWVLHGVTLGTLLWAALGGLVAYRAWKASPPEQPNSTRGSATGFRHHLAFYGLVLDALFGLAVVLEGLPVAMLSPCW